MNKSDRVGKVQNDERADWSAAWMLFPGNIAYVWHGALHAATVAESLTREGFAIQAQIIWAKERLVIGRRQAAAALRLLHRPRLPFSMCWTRKHSRSG